jgi:DNA-binding NtrC family response regulator
MELLLMRHNFLFIGKKMDLPSLDTLTKALTTLGELQFLSQKEAMEQIHASSYSLIFVDAAILDSKMLLISQIRTQLPNARILVLTASPTWRRAREALKAGAMDYLSNSLSEQEYLNTFRDILDRTPSPWP